MNFTNTLLLGSVRASGGSSEPTITIAAPTWADNFNSYANGTRLVAGDPNLDTGLINANPGNLGWDVLAGTPTNVRFNNIVFDGRLRSRTTNRTADGGVGTHVICPPLTQSGDQYIEMTVETAKGEFQFRPLNFRASDANNKLVFRLQDRTPSPVSTVTLRSVIAGAEATVVEYQAGGATLRRMGGATNGAAKPYQATERLRALHVNGRVWIRRGDGFPLGVLAGTAFTSLSGNRFGCGVSGGNHSDWIDAASAGPCPTVLILNETYPVWVPKRRASASDAITSGFGDATFTGTYEGVPPTRLMWGLSHLETGAEIKSLALVPSADVTITPVTGSTGTWTARLRAIPCGLNGREAYSPRFVPVDASDVAHPAGGVCGIQEFYVTLNIGGIGQSNIADIANTALSGSIPTEPGSAAYFNNVPPSTAVGQIAVGTAYYSGTASGGGRLCVPLCNILSAYWNVPVSFESLGIGARGAGVLGPIDGSTGSPHPSSDWAHIQQQHGYAGGAYDILVLSQGENEASGGGDLWEVRWQANIAAYRNPAMSGQPAGTVIPVFYGITGHVADDPGATGISASINARNLGQVNLQSSVSNCFLVYHHEGAARQTGDLVHFEKTITTGYAELARRIGLSIRRHYAGSGLSGLGPFATGMTRSGAVLTIPYNLNGADSLQARAGRNSATAGSNTALTSWQVSADNFATTLTISSAVISGSNVVITLAADPGAPVRARNCSGNLPDVTSYVHGLYSDGSYIGSLPVHVPLLSN